MTKIRRVLQSTALFCAAIGFLFAATGNAEAADIQSEPETVPQPVATDEWVVSTAPYFWVTFYEGDMTINGQTVDMSGTNVFDLLDAGELNFPPLVNYFEARKGRWGGYLDTTLIGLNFAASDIALGPGPIGVTAAVDLDFTYALVNAGLIYTAAEWAQQNGTVAFDLMGGVRYTYYDIDLGVMIGPVAGSFADTLDWWDVTLGARLRGQTNNGWNWALRGDIAGADLESSFSVQAIANVGRDFRLGRLDATWVAGYRFLYQDWSEGTDAVDLLTHGPLVGLKINF
jgi:hypothetical protein